MSTNEEKAPQIQRDALRGLHGLPTGVVITDRILAKRSMQKITDIREAAGINRKKFWWEFWK